MLLVIPSKVLEEPDELLAHEIPSDEVTTSPELPTDTKMSSANEVILRTFEVPDNLGVHEYPSVELRIVPE